MAVSRLLLHLDGVKDTQRQKDGQNHTFGDNHLDCPCSRLQQALPQPSCHDKRIITHDGILGLWYLYLYHIYIYIYTISIPYLYLSLHIYIYIYIYIYMLDIPDILDMLDILDKLNTLDIPYILNIHHISHVQMFLPARGFDQHAVLTGTRFWPRIRHIRQIHANTCEYVQIR